MRPWSLISLLVCAACTVRLPTPGQVAISVQTTTRVEARVHQPEAAVIVPIQDASVVEFFGIPLEGSGEVVFVLDCSGSMADAARGRLAEIRVAPSPPPSVTPPPEAADAPPPEDTLPLDDMPPPDGTSPEPEPEPAPAPAPRPRKIDVARAELVEALERLPAGTRMNVLFFNNEVEGFAPGMLPLEDDARGGLIEFVRGIEPTGATALAPAMRFALLMNARRIVLLSDGRGNVGGNAAAVLRDARAAIRGGVRIDTIGLGGDQDVALLQALASESGGLYQRL